MGFKAIGENKGMSLFSRHSPGYQILTMHPHSGPPWTWCGRERIRSMQGAAMCLVFWKG
jgi:hypothetical protein